MGWGEGNWGEAHGSCTLSLRGQTGSMNGWTWDADSSYGHVGNSRWSASGDRYDALEATLEIIANETLRNKTMLETILEKLAVVERIVQETSRNETLLENIQANVATMEPAESCRSRAPSPRRQTWEAQRVRGRSDSPPRQSRSERNGMTRSGSWPVCAAEMPPVSAAEMPCSWHGTSNAQVCDVFAVTTSCMDLIKDPTSPAMNSWWTHIDSTIFWNRCHYSQRIVDRLKVLMNDNLCGLFTTYS